MLTAISMTYRYRMEFYPEIDLLAFLGFYAATSSVGPLAIVHRYRGWTIAATLASVISAHGALLLYNNSPGGPFHSIEYCRARSCQKCAVAYYILGCAMR
jgi:hypothetical protein